MPKYNPRERKQTIVGEMLLKASLARRPMFRFKASIGRFPKEAYTYVFVKRKDPLTNVSLTVPEMLYPLETNRLPVPKHQLLEDDWRAFRSVFHNYQSLLRYQQHPQARVQEYDENNEIVERILNSMSRPVVQLMDIQDSLKPVMKPPRLAHYVPTLAVYKDNVDPPSGYMYRRYKQGLAARKEKLQDLVSTDRQVLKTPILVFEGPYMDVAHIPHGKHVKKQWDDEMKYYDADAIVGGPTNRNLYFYNEPDAVPVSCLRKDYSIPLSKLVEDIATSENPSTDATKLPRIPLAIFDKNPVPELMECFTPGS